MDTTRTTDYRTNPEITDPGYSAWLRSIHLKPEYVVTKSLGERRILRRGYELTLRASERTAEIMINREYPVCTVCRNYRVAPGEEMCEVCISTADEYAAEWDDIVSGRDMHNTCAKCHGDAHNNTICADCTDWPRHCAVRGCDGVAATNSTYCRKCRDEIDGTPVRLMPRFDCREWFDRFAAYPFTHEREVTRAFYWIIGVLLVLGAVAQVGMARGWWGR